MAPWTPPRLDMESQGRSSHFSSLPHRSHKSPTPREGSSHRRGAGALARGPVWFPAPQVPQEWRGLGLPLAPLTQWKATRPADAPCTADMARDSTGDVQGFLCMV